MNWTDQRYTLSLTLGDVPIEIAFERATPADAYALASEILDRLGFARHRTWREATIEYAAQEGPCRTEYWHSIASDRLGEVARLEWFVARGEEGDGCGH